MKGKNLVNEVKKVKQSELSERIMFQVDGNVFTQALLMLPPNYDNINKIKSLYSDSVNIEEYYISTELLDDKQNEYDLLLSKTDDIYEVREVVDNILNLYRGEDTIKLVLAK